MGNRKGQLRATGVGASVGATQKEPTKRNQPGSLTCLNSDSNLPRVSSLIIGSKDARKNDDVHWFLPPALMSACGCSVFQVFSRTIKKTHPAKNERIVAIIAINPLRGLYFLSGTLGESITRNPNCSRFRAIISFSTS